MTLQDFIGVPVSERVELLLGYDSENIPIILNEIGQDKLVFNNTVGIILLTIALVERKAAGQDIQIVRDETPQLQNIFEDTDIVRVFITFPHEGSSRTIPLWILRSELDTIETYVSAIGNSLSIEEFRNQMVMTINDNVHEDPNILWIRDAIETALPPVYSALINYVPADTLTTYYFQMPQTVSASTASTTITTTTSDNTFDLINPIPDYSISINEEGTSIISPESEVTSETEATPEPEEPLETLPGISQDLNTTARFQGAPWFDEISRKVGITLIGLGGIGSWTALLAARLNPRDLIMLDPDTVEGLNMSGQLHPSAYVGYPKSRSMRETILAFCNRGVAAPTGRVTDDPYSMPFNQIIICGLDNMLSRKACFENWLYRIRLARNEVKATYLFIDGRLTATEFQIFAIPGDDQRAIEEYQSRWLFADTDAEATVCSFKQTSHLAAMIGAMIINILTNFVTNYLNGIPMAEVPFKTEFTAATMTLKVE